MILKFTVMIILSMTWGALVTFLVPNSPVASLLFSLAGGFLIGRLMFSPEDTLIPIKTDEKTPPANKDDHNNDDEGPNTA